MGTIGGAVRILLGYARPHRWVLLGGAVLAVLGSAAGLAQPLAAKAVIDTLAADGSLAPSLVTLSVLVLASAAINGGYSWLLARTGERVVLTVRQTVAGRLVRLRIPELDVRQPGDLVARATADTTLLRTATTSALVQLVNGTVGLVGALVLMAVLNLLLFVVTAAVLVVVGIVVGVVLPRIRAATTRAQESVGLIGAALDRALGAARTVKASGAEQRETTAVHAAAERSYRAGLDSARWNAVLAVVSELSFQASFLAVLGVGGALVAAGTLPVSTLVAFLLYLFYLTVPVSELIMAGSSIQQGLGAAQRLTEVDRMAVEPDVDPTGVVFPRSDRPPAIELDDVRFSYPGRDPVLHGISLRVPGSTSAALVGPSGAGKSTIFSLLMRFHEPDGGRITLDGRSLAGLARVELRRRVGFVEQDAPALAGTFGENLRYAAPEATDTEVAEVLRATRLDELVAQLPSGLDTHIGPRGVALSGGERQRLAIARALLRHPEVLLLDEATSQLDARNEEALRETMRRAADYCTVLVIAHRLSTVRDVDHIVVLEAGRVRATGRHDELLASDPLYQELAATQLIQT
ncbi:MAG: ABC transporter ATP-binding protein [Pseudonocardiaceae bacterium]